MIKYILVVSLASLASAGFINQLNQPQQISTHESSSQALQHASSFEAGHQQSYEVQAIQQPISSHGDANAALSYQSSGSSQYSSDTGSFSGHEALRGNLYQNEASSFGSQFSLGSQLNQFSGAAQSYSSQSYQPQIETHQSQSILPASSSQFSDLGDSFNSQSFSQYSAPAPISQYGAPAQAAQLPSLPISQPAPISQYGAPAQAAQLPSLPISQPAPISQYGTPAQLPSLPISQPAPISESYQPAPAAISPPTVVQIEQSLSLPVAQPAPVLLPQPPQIAQPLLLPQQPAPQLIQSGFSSGSFGFGSGLQTVMLDTTHGQGENHQSGGHDNTGYPENNNNQGGYPDHDSNNGGYPDNSAGYPESGNNNGGGSSDGYRYDKPAIRFDLPTRSRGAH
ncbi:hypothetical protein TKK_0008836 [Trichogramma kaykai]